MPFELVECLDSLHAAGFRAYEMEDDVTKDLAEFSLASGIYAALIEGHAFGQSTRYRSLLQCNFSHL